MKSLINNFTILIYDYTQHYTFCTRRDWARRTFFFAGVYDRFACFLESRALQTRRITRKAARCQIRLPKSHITAGAINLEEISAPFGFADDFFDVTCGTPLSFLPSRATPIPSTHVTSLLWPATTYALDFIHRIPHRAAWSHIAPLRYGALTLRFSLYTRAYAYLATSLSVIDLWG